MVLVIKPRIKFIETVTDLAKQCFGVDYSQKSICYGSGFAVDFYFPEEATVAELAFGLHNPNTEYERDIFKCLLAIDCGYAIRRLLFISKPGARPTIAARSPGNCKLGEAASWPYSRDCRGTT